MRPSGSEARSKRCGQIQDVGDTGTRNAKQLARHAGEVFVLVSGEMCQHREGMQLPATASLEQQHSLARRDTSDLFTAHARHISQVCKHQVTWQTSADELASLFHACASASAPSSASTTPSEATIRRIPRPAHIDTHMDMDAIAFIMMPVPHTPSHKDRQSMPDGQHDACLPINSHQQFERVHCEQSAERTAD